MKHERTTHRRQAVEALRARLQRANWPRLQMSAITALTGASGFLASWLLLHAGLHRMALRYALSVLAAYGVFLLLLRVWLFFYRRTLGRIDASGVGDLAEGALDGVLQGGIRGAGQVAQNFRPGGGSFGGAGSSTAFEAPIAPSAPPAFISSGPASGSATGSGGSGKAGFDLSNLVPDLDADEAIVLVVVLAIALSVLAASLWLVLAAPTLFAELLVDSALAGGLYRQLRRNEETSWLETALKKTAIPFAIVLLVAAVGGGVIQHYVPQAHSVGDVFRGELSKP